MAESSLKDFEHIFNKLSKLSSDDFDDFINHLLALREQPPKEIPEELKRKTEIIAKQYLAMVTTEVDFEVKVEGSFTLNKKGSPVFISNCSDLSITDLFETSDAYCDVLSKFDWALSLIKQEMKKIAEKFGFSEAFVRNLVDEKIAEIIHSEE